MKLNIYHKVKKINILLSLLILFFFVSNSFAQHEYLFNGSLNGTGGGPVLTQSLTCGATSGTFSTQTISTSAGFCVTDMAFCFNDGGGLQYANPSYITNQYTIHLFFKFNTISGWSRIIDFSNSTADAGIYLLNDCLNFYPNGNVGPCPTFTSGLWYLMSFIRDGSTNIVSVYVNGVLFASYNDGATNTYRCATNTTPILFFRDDNSVSCEAQPGCVKYLSISSGISTAAQVANTWTNLCSIIALPVTFSNMEVSCVNRAQKVHWTTLSENNTDYFSVEKSIDGNNWTELEKISGAGHSNSANAYEVTDEQPFETTYYRIKQVDFNGDYNYSEIMVHQSCEDREMTFSVYPNPSQDIIHVTSGYTGKLELFNLIGAKICEYDLKEGENVFNLPESAHGTYLLKSANNVEKLVIL